MVSDWLKTQKKPTRTNQIRAVVFSKQRFDFEYKTRIEQVKNIPKPEYSKNYVFLALCIENVVLSQKYCQQNLRK